MRIGNREVLNNNIENSLNNLHNDIEAYNKIFDTVIVVNPYENQIFSIENSSFKNTNFKCQNICPLSKDKCGCICKDSLSSKSIKTRFTFNKREAYIVICKPLKTKYREFTLILINKLDASFSFGSFEADEAVKQITKISSNLVIDPLTKLFNRKYLTDNIEYQIQDAVNNNKQLCLACIDIDNFKKFNDTYGHDFGDKVLKKVADCMSESIHGLDDSYCVRIGGDEFLIIGLNINKARFKNIMNKLCQIISSTELNYNREIVHICISIGVAEVAEDKAYCYKELYDKADKQLYAAKEAGKGCVR